VVNGNSPQGPGAGGVKKKSGEMKVALAILLSVVYWIGFSWAEMIAAGILHAHWWTLVPPAGFHVALYATGIIMLVRFLGGFFHAFVKD